MNTVQNADLRILLALADLCTITNRRYCWPSQDWLLSTLKTRYRRAISRRHLNRHLLSLQNAGLIRRTVRHRRGPTGALEMHSTLYHVTGSALKLLSRLTKPNNKSAAASGGALNSHRVPAPAQYLKSLYRLEAPPAASGQSATPPTSVAAPTLAARDWGGLLGWLRQRE